MGADGAQAGGPPVERGLTPQEQGSARRGSNCGLGSENGPFRIKGLELVGPEPRRLEPDRDVATDRGS